MKPQVSDSESYWHALFEFGIFIKGLNGIWETISGFLVLFVNKVTFDNIFYSLARGELLEDPNDLVMNFVGGVLQNLSAETKTFAAIYILTHGLLNIFLAIQLYRNRLWAYLVTISAMVVFIIYQSYRIGLYHSQILTVITVFDVLFIFLTVHEYRYQRSLAVGK